MKRFFAAILSLVMIAFALSLSGCKKSKHSDSELFELGLNRLLIPELAKIFADDETLEDANRFAFSLDKLEITSSLLGEKSVYPEISFEAVESDEGIGRASLNVAMGEEKLSGIVELLEDEKLYASFPDATELYLSCTLDELMTKIISEFANDGNSISTAFLLGSCASLDNSCLDDKLDSEKTGVKVFGEETDDLKKITLSLSGEDLSDIFGDMLGLIPEEAADGDALQADDETNTKVTMSVYMDGEDLKKFEYSMNKKDDGHESSVMLYVDVENTEDIYRLDGEVKKIADGEETASVTVKSDIAYEDGIVKGEIKLKPKFGLASAEDEASEEIGTIGSMLDDLAITILVEGELDEDSLDIEASAGITMGMVTLKIPYSLKGEKNEDKLALEFKFDAAIIGMMDISAGASFEIEKTSDVKPGTYDEENAFGLDDEEKSGQFASEIEEYFSSLEGLKGFLEGTKEADSYLDTDIDDTPTLLFNVYSDELDMYFYSDGTGDMTSNYDAAIDGDTITLHEDGEEALVITMTSDTTADIAGMEFDLEIVDLGDGDVTYVISSDAYKTEINVDVSSMRASVGEQFTYSMDATMLTFDGEKFPYYLDEENGIFNLNGNDYNFISYVE